MLRPPDIVPALWQPLHERLNTPFTASVDCNSVKLTVAGIAGAGAGDGAGAGPGTCGAPVVTQTFTTARSIVPSSPPGGIGLAPLFMRELIVIARPLAAV